MLKVLGTLLLQSYEKYRTKDDLYFGEGLIEAIVSTNYSHHEARFKLNKKYAKNNVALSEATFQLDSLIIVDKPSIQECASRAKMDYYAASDKINQVYAIVAKKAKNATDAESTERRRTQALKDAQDAADKAGNIAVDK